MSDSIYYTYRSFLGNSSNKIDESNIYPELEYVYHLNKNSYDKIKNGNFKNFSYSEGLDTKKVFEISKNLIRHSKIVARVVKDVSTNSTTNKTYIKTRLQRIRVGNSDFFCNFSTERAVMRDLNNNELDYIEFTPNDTLQKSTRSTVKTPSGFELELVGSLFGDESSYRIEFECGIQHTIDDWELVKREIMTLVSLSIGNDERGIDTPNLKYFVQQFAMIIGDKYKDATTLRSFLLNPVNYDRAANIQHQPDDFIGTIKLDGKIAALCTVKQGWLLLGLDFGAERVMQDEDDYVEKIDDAKDLLVFGEYMTDSEVFWMFDVIVWNGNNVSNQINEKRMKLLPEVGKYLNSLKLKTTVKFKDKTFLPMEDSNNFDKLWNDNSGLKTDGIILYQKKKPYSANNSAIYKLKPKHLNTIDLFLHKKNTTLFLCIIKLPDRNINWDQAAELRGVGESLFGNKIKLYQLFMPGYGNVGIAEISSCTYGNDIKKTIMHSENCNFVVECLWVAEKSSWHILKARPSKRMPNAHKVVLANFNLSVFPIEKDEFYSSSQSFYKYMDDERYKLFNAYASHCTRYQIQYWLGALKNGESYFKKMPIFDVFEDMAAGRGGRLNDINLLSIRKRLIFTDISQQSLGELTSRISLFAGKNNNAIKVGGYLKKILNPSSRGMNMSKNNIPMGRINDYPIANAQQKIDIINKMTQDIPHNANRIVAWDVGGMPIYEYELKKPNNQIQASMTSDTYLNINGDLVKKNINRKLYDRYSSSRTYSNQGTTPRLKHGSVIDVNKYTNPINTIKDIRIQQIDLTSMSDVLREIDLRNGEKVDAFIMIYAIHYMFSHESAFEAFAKYLNDNSSPNALFFTNIIDVELALGMDLKRYNVMPIGEFNLKLPFNNMFNFSIPFKSQIPGQLVYNTEPGLTSKILIQQMDKIGWELLGSGPMFLKNNSDRHVPIKIELVDRDDKQWRNAHITFCFSKKKKITKHHC